MVHDLRSTGDDHAVLGAEAHPTPVEYLVVERAERQSVLDDIGAALLFEHDVRCIDADQCVVEPPVVSADRSLTSPIVAVVSRYCSRTNLYAFIVRFLSPKRGKTVLPRAL